MTWNRLSLVKSLALVGFQISAMSGHRDAGHGRQCDCAATTRGGRCRCGLCAWSHRMAHVASNISSHGL